MALTSRKLACWNIELMQYNFTFEYQKGSSNDLCNMLSRHQYDNDKRKHFSQSDCEHDVLQLFENIGDQNKQEKEDTYPKPMQNDCHIEKPKSVNVIHCPNAHKQTEHVNQLATSSHQTNYQKL